METAFKPYRPEAFWSKLRVRLPDPALVSARAEAAYQRALSLEDRVQLAKRAGRRSAYAVPLKTGAELAAILAEQKSLLGVAVGVVLSESLPLVSLVPVGAARNRFMALLIEAADFQRRALDVTRWAQLNVLGASEMADAVIHLRSAAKALETVSKEIFALQAATPRSEGVGVQVVSSVRVARDAKRRRASKGQCAVTAARKVREGARTSL